MNPFTQIILIGSAALCAAQLQNLPDCAKPCAASLPAQCHLDVSCICSDSDWITGISCCIKNGCSPSDQQQTLNVAVQLCDTVNVKLPSAASCPASASATAAGGSATAGSNTVAGGTTPTTSAVTGANSSSTTSTSGASTTTSTSATGSSSSTTKATTSSATQATGAAKVLGSNMGAVGAAMAALALL